MRAKGLEPPRAYACSLSGSGTTLGPVGQLPESDDDDLLRRLLIERRYPLTWKGILGCALASIVGLVLVLAGVGGFWEVLAAFLFVAGALLVLKGVLRMTWLRLGGTDRPLRTYIRRRFGE